MSPKQYGMCYKALITLDNQGKKAVSIRQFASMAGISKKQAKDYLDAISKDAGYWDNHTQTWRLYLHKRQDQAVYWLKTRAGWAYAYHASVIPF